jgi:hypothetical protein
LSGYLVVGYTEYRKRDLCSCCSSPSERRTVAIPRKTKIPLTSLPSRFIKCHIEQSGTRIITGMYENYSAFWQDLRSIVSEDHSFTYELRNMLQTHFDDDGNQIYDHSPGYNYTEMDIPYIERGYNYGSDSDSDYSAPS